MAREQVANYSHHQRKVTCLKIVGWSVNYSRESILECVASLEHIQTLVHYPQLNTTYVKMRVSGRRTELVCAALAESFPRAKIELEPECDILKSEQELEQPDTTAFISSNKFINETRIHKDLKQFGSLRALNFGYSARHQLWFCKASFYEKYSLDLILNNKQTVTRFISDGAKIKLERVRGANYQGGVSASRPQPVYQAQGTCVQTAGEIQQISTNYSSTGFYRFESTAKQLSHTTGIRKSKSCERSRAECLPAYNTFRNSNLYIENALKIHRSRKAEHAPKPVRSASVRKLIREQVQVQLGIVVPTNSSRRKLVVNTYTFEENELLFLEIGKTNPNVHNLYASISNGQQNLQREINKDQISYLSLDDLSDGYSAIEEGAEMQTIKEETFLVFSSKNSEKEASRVPLTKYSSDAEHSLQKSPSDSRFDCIFGSDSALNCGRIAIVGACRPTFLDRSQTATHHYFTFPSY